MTEEIDNEILGLTADIVAAHVSNNRVAANEVSDLIAQVHAALSGLASPPAVAEPEPTPAVPVRSSVKHDYIVCLEDGKKLKMLKRYLYTNYKMTPDDYRAKWKLPRDYPMVAPAYAEQRRGLAQKIGLGRKKATDETEAPAAKAPAKPRAKKVAEPAPAVVEGDTAPRRRGRPKKVAAEA
jgi:predicted transcriptional regulator